MFSNSSVAELALPSLLHLLVGDGHESEFGAFAGVIENTNLIQALGCSDGHRNVGAAKVLAKAMGGWNHQYRLGSWRAAEHALCPGFSFSARGSTNFKFHCTAPLGILPLRFFWPSSSSFRRHPAAPQVDGTVPLLVSIPARQARKGRTEPCGERRGRDSRDGRLSVSAGTGRSARNSFFSFP